MLPDLRVLLIATVSTFLVATCAAFFVSVHVVPDQLAQPDQSTPVSRVAVSWQDVSRATLHAINLAALRNIPDSASDAAPAESTSSTEPAAAQPVSKTEPAVSQPAQDAAKDESSSDAEPASTGTISAAPPESDQDAQQLAARPDPADAEEEVEEQQPGATPPARHKAKAGTRSRKRHRYVHRDIFGNPTRARDASDLSFEFFTNFGSTTR